MSDDGFLQLAASPRPGGRRSHPRGPVVFTLVLVLAVLATLALIAIGTDLLGS